MALIRDASLAAEPATWADLGCGDGTFTLALAALLPKGSTIHAVDREASALRRIPRAHAGTSIVTHLADFTALPWPFGDLDGVMLANSLHYVRHLEEFLQRCAGAMAQPRFLIVEYDLEQPNRWVPYPVSRRRLESLLAGAADASIRWLGTRPSIYRRASLYAAVVETKTSGV